MKDRKHNEREWRDAKDEVIKSLVDEQRQRGQLPDTNVCERFFAEEVVPQMKDVEERQVKASVFRKDLTPVTEVLKPGEARREGDGQLTSKGNIRGPNIPRGYRVVLGGEVKDPTPRYKSVDDWVVAHCFRIMRKQPAWKKRVLDVFATLPPIAVEAREKAFRKIFDDWLRFYGPYENIKQAWLKGPERRRLYSVPSK